MRKLETLPVTLLSISAVLYAAALSQPVWACGKGGSALGGFDVLISGYLGLMFLDPRWFCNALMLIALVSALGARHRAFHGLALVLAIAASTTAFGPFLCGVGGGPLGDGTALASGGWLWIGALWFAALSVLVASARAAPAPQSDA